MPVESRTSPRREPPLARLRTRVRAGLRWLFRLRGSPEEVAFGLAIGTFVAFTPTIGLQLVLAALLATLLGANRPAAIVAVAITNPLTIPPAFALTYWVGSLFWAGPPVGRVYEVMVEAGRHLGRRDFWELGEQLGIFFALGRDIFVPLWIGGVLVGALAGGVAYLLCVHAVRRYRQRRARRRAARLASARE